MPEFARRTQPLIDLVLIAEDLEMVLLRFEVELGVVLLTFEVELVVVLLSFEVVLQ